VDVAGDVDGVWRCAEADDFSVEADGDVDFVFAGEEEEGVAFGAELIVLLDLVDLVDLGLDFGGGCGGGEEQDVGAEVGGFLGLGGKEEEWSQKQDECGLGTRHLGPREFELNGNARGGEYETSRRVDTGRLHEFFWMTN